MEMSLYICSERLLIWYSTHLSVPLSLAVWYSTPLSVLRSLYCRVWDTTLLSVPLTLKQHTSLSVPLCLVQHRTPSTTESRTTEHATQYHVTRGGCADLLVLVGAGEMLGAVQVQHHLRHRPHLGHAHRVSDACAHTEFQTCAALAKPRACTLKC
eukprot:289558-Rhodomonas_salina.7